MEVCESSPGEYTCKTGLEPGMSEKRKGLGANLQQPSKTSGQIRSIFEPTLLLTTYTEFESMA